MPIRKQYKQTSKTPAVDILKHACTNWRTAGTIHLLGVDLGTTGGFASHEYNFSGSSPVRLLTELTTETFGAARAPAGEVFLHFQEYLHSKLVQHNPGYDYIAYEDVRRYEYPMQTRRWCGLLALLQVAATEHDIKLLPVPVMGAKKVATGNGHAKKPEVQQWGRIFLTKHSPELFNARKGVITTDEADALSMGEWVYRTAKDITHPTNGKGVTR